MLLNVYSIEIDSSTSLQEYPQLYVRMVTRTVSSKVHGVVTAACHYFVLYKLKVWFFFTKFI